MFRFRPWIAIAGCTAATLTARAQLPGPIYSGTAIAVGNGHFDNIPVTGPGYDSVGEGSMGSSFGDAQAYISIAGTDGLHVDAYSQAGDFGQGAAQSQIQFAVEVTGPGSSAAVDFRFSARAQTSGGSYDVASAYLEAFPVPGFSGQYEGFTGNSVHNESVVLPTDETITFILNVSSQATSSTSSGTDWATADIDWLSWSIGPTVPDADEYSILLSPGIAGGVMGTPPPSPAPDLGMSIWSLFIALGAVLGMHRAAKSEQ